MCVWYVRGYMQIYAVRYVVSDSILEESVLSFPMHGVLGLTKVMRLTWQVL